MDFILSSLWAKSWFISFLCALALFTPSRSIGENLVCVPLSCSLSRGTDAARQICFYLWKKEGGWGYKCVVLALKCCIAQLLRGHQGHATILGCSFPLKVLLTESVSTLVSWNFDRVVQAIVAGACWFWTTRPLLARTPFYRKTKRLFPLLKLSIVIAAF